MSHPAPKMLCVVPNWIGDAVLALPALHLLADAGVSLHLVGKSSLQRIFQEVRGETHWLDLPRRRTNRLRLAWSLREMDFSGALLLTPSFSSALFAWCTGAGWRLGESRAGRGFLLTDGAGRLDRNRHLALSYQELAQRAIRLLSVPTPAPLDTTNIPGMLDGLREVPRIRVRSHEQESLTALPPVARSAIIVAPGARYGPAKQYPAERFAAAARTLAQESQQAIVLVGTADDATATAAVHRLLPEAIDLTAATNLGQLLALLANARVVLANDSGIMHLAAALGSAVIGVFGSTNPAWTAPLGPRARYISHPVFCSPCYAPHCREDFACMLQQPAQKLVAAARQLLENTSL